MLGAQGRTEGLLAALPGHCLPLQGPHGPGGWDPLRPPPLAPPEKGPAWPHTSVCPGPEGGCWILQSAQLLAGRPF